MSVAEAIETLRGEPRFARNIVVWQLLPERPARYGAFPQDLAAPLVEALHDRGLASLYSHQVQAFEATRRGENVAIVTGTASGKTLAYNLPVLQALLEDDMTRALYLFPTKALGQDQAHELGRWAQALRGALPAEVIDLGVRLYDGDTPQAERARVRGEVRLLLSNPDMLHTGILPHHTRWADYLSNLRYVILDELHTYSGVFGSHMANVLRRLRRICAFYGAQPQFLCASATIANPRELAETLLEAPVTLIEEDGSPRAARHFAVYNPPLVDEALGLRRSYVLESQAVAAMLLRSQVQTVLFARTRRTVELLLGYLREQAQADGLDPQRVRGYRAGYLPEERRRIEAGLRSGEVRGVVATNALELGVDIGTLGAAVLVGYPGRIASLWQQAGRAGRREEQGLAVLVASPSPLDQFLTLNPRYLFDRSPEQARINPNNLAILANHLRCAAFELPLRGDESFGTAPIAELLEALHAEGDLLRSAEGEYQASGEAYPAALVGLRSSTNDRVLIQETGERGPRLIGEVDRAAAPVWVHVGAVYMHEGRTYIVERLDWEQGVAEVRQANLDYYTEASESVQVEILGVEDADEARGVRRAFGPLEVTAQAVAYRKVRRHTHETLGFGEIDLPPREFRTTGCWVWLAPPFVQRLQADLAGRPDLLRTSFGPNDYGPSWEPQRQAALERDGHRCTQCGVSERPGRAHDVHHRTPFRAFGYIPGQNENHAQANALDNLLALCQACHHRLEAQQGTRTALGGLAYALHSLAPLFLMCDSRDLGMVVEMRAKETRGPTITFYDEVPEGIGLTDALYAVIPELLANAADLIGGCGCSDGCPACVGPVAPASGPVKATALFLAQAMVRELGASGR
jgi:DEAD/DEAH box helicase domain-containing protein